jgi:NADH dehydrogenase
VVILGAGFGGLAAARALRHARVEVLVIDRHNYHLFQPLLYQVATAGLAPNDIAQPIRSILGRQDNAAVMLAKVTGVDVARKQVLLDDRRVAYDDLVIATGARHAYFGHDDWEAHAHGLKRIDDATFLRRKILLAFERAEAATDPASRRRWLNFVVVGGGPTGVEMAGAIMELARRALAADFRAIDPREARVTLVQSAPRILPSFAPGLSRAAHRRLEVMGVDIRLSSRVTGCDALGVSIDAARIESGTIVWAAGVMASPAGQWLGAETDAVGRVRVRPDLSVPGAANVFVIGDTALTQDRRGRALPGLAPVAKQQGLFVARLLARRARNPKARGRFAYRGVGLWATIGRRSAVIQAGPVRLSGPIAWGLWSLAHIYLLIGFRNKVAVAASWAWNYVTFQRGARLITGDDSNPAPRDAM